MINLNEHFLAILGSIPLSTLTGYKGKSITLICPYMSTTHSVLWFGPENLVSYTRNLQINTDLPRQHRIRIIGNVSIGKYNLQIQHLSRIDDGLYRCASVVKGRSVTADFSLTILRKLNTIS